MSAKLFVGNLSFQATEEDLRELFAQAGNVETVRIITDQFTGRPRGFGFVEMATKEEAQKAAVERGWGRLAPLAPWSEPGATFRARSIRSKRRRSPSGLSIRKGRAERYSLLARP